MPVAPNLYTMHWSDPALGNFRGIRANSDRVFGLGTRSPCVVVVTPADNSQLRDRLQMADLSFSSPFATKDRLSSGYSAKAADAD
ncbi:MAG: hypothetical protein P4L03_04465 [Terracidiphilus sp.]|nr:hypothetical protein [Terracidiphilus sp.]